MCSAVTADDAQLLRRDSRIVSADFAPSACAPRAKRTPHMRAFGCKACDCGAKSCARLRRACSAAAADDLQFLRRNPRIFVADFAPILQAPREKETQKMRCRAGVRGEKSVMWPRKLCGCASRVQCRDTAVTADDAQLLRRDSRIVSADFAPNACAPRAKRS